MPEFHCGEALCKKPLAELLQPEQAWPVRCKHCGMNLYPRDVLDELPINELAPTRSVLQKNLGGRLVEAHSGDVGGILHELEVGEAGGDLGSGDSAEPEAAAADEAIGLSEASGFAEPSEWDSPWILLLSGLVIGIGLTTLLYAFFY